MARSYATLLGCLGFAVTLIRGLLRGADPCATLLHAWLALLGFAALGLAGGLMADHVLSESFSRPTAARRPTQDAAARSRHPR